MSEPTVSLPAATPDPDLEVGQQVGEYIVEARIGEGAFGTVFRAAHPLIGKVVAIKVLARKFSVDPEIVSRFQAEARAVNQIRHRNIIDIFSFGTLDDGRHYYVMEHLDGETLDARISRETRLSLADALPILRGIGRALDAAHAKGIAHRDLKAENVFLGADGGGEVFPKLLDFGIAKLMAPEDGLKHKTRTGTPVGTPYYMSPEQCRGRDVDHRTDLYAFGVLAYLLLTGKYPHDADDYMSILMRQLTEHPDPPSSVVDDLPAGVDDAIGWLIAKDPADRPPNLRTAVGAFEAAAEAAGITVGTDVWDVHTPPPGLATQPPNVGAARISGMPAKPPSNPWARKSAKPVAPPPRKPRGRLYAAIGGVVVAATIVVVVVIQPWATTSTPPVAQPEPKPVHVPVKVDPPGKPAPAPLPETHSVIVTVTGVPDGTEVLVGGMTVGAAPGPVQLPRDAAQQVVLVFKADGYKLESRTILADKDQTLKIELKKKPVVAPTKKPSKDDIIEVFKK